jgi:hypothetical protein
MNIWSKVLVGVILVATLPFFYLSARLLKTNKAWRDEINRWQAAAKQATYGPPDLDTLARDVRDASVKLHDVIVDRGRVWQDVKPERAFNSNTGKGSVSIESPSPHRLTPKMVLFAFDSTGYLGEFQITEAGEKSVALEPHIKMSDRQLKRVASSASNWTLYEVMPIDRNGLFAGLDKDALSKLLPAERVDEYLKDGQEALASDPPERVLTIDGKRMYERRLNDYEMLFHEMDRQIAVASDLRLAAQKDAASLEAAVADAKKQVEFHAAEIADLKKELARSQAERELMTAQCKALNQAIAQTRGEMKQAFQENRAMAQDWAEIQTRLAQQRGGSSTVTE